MPPLLRARRGVRVRGSTHEDSRYRRTRENENVIVLANHYNLVTRTDEKPTMLSTQ